MWGLNWVQTVCKGYQQTTPESKELIMTHKMTLPVFAEYHGLYKSMGPCLLEKLVLKINQSTERSKHYLCLLRILSYKRVGIFVWLIQYCHGLF